MKAPKNKQKKVFDELYNKHQHDVYNYCLFMVHDKQLAEDIFQEVWTSFFQTMNDGVDLKKSRSYLFKAAKNICIDKLSNDKKFLEYDELLIKNQDNDMDFTDDTYSDEIISQIVKLSKGINPEAFDCFVQVKIFDFTYKEIAEEKDCTEDGIRKKVSRVIKYLRTKIER